MKKVLSAFVTVLILSVICLFAVNVNASEQGSADNVNPVIITSVNKSGTDIDLTWNSVDCSGYVIRFATRIDFSNAKEIIINDGNINSYTITNRSPDANYYVTVTSFTTNDNATVYSNSSKIWSTAFNGSMPARMSGLSFLNEANAIILRWDAIDDITGYQIVSYDTTTGKYSSVKYLPAGTTLYKITGLKSSTLYRYNIRGYKTVNGENFYGPYTDLLTTRTKSAATTITQLSKSGSVINVKWKTVQGSGYVIRFATRSDLSNYKDIYVNDSHTGSYMITGRDKTANYYVTVIPYTTLGDQKYYSSKSPVWYTGYEGPVMNKVSGLNFSNETNAITLKWNKISDVTGYQIVIYDTSAKKYKSVKYVSASTTSTKITGLKPSTLYRYNVRGYRTKNGENFYGPYTDLLTTRTLSSPTEITYLSKSGSNINVKWKTVQGSGYVIKYATRSDLSNSESIYINDSHIGSYTITGRNKTANYYVTITPYTTLDNRKFYSAQSEIYYTEYSKKLASYYSYYVNNANRTNNIILASRAINGTVIMPGETFSFNKVVGQRTYSKGYKDAPVFTGSGVSNGVGGGICQVASTMFNTALLADVQIVERSQHSQRVSYVPLGRDAAISWGSQDFKWKNNTKYPIKIYITVSDGKITCDFFTDADATKPNVDLKVSQSGNVFTLRRYSNGSVNYTTRSKY